MTRQKTPRPKRPSVHPPSTPAVLALAMALAAALAAPSAIAPTAEAAEADAGRGDWPQFRGPGATGIAPGPAPPLEWDGESGHNVLWQAPIPGLAHSSPVVWGDRVFLTTAVDEKSYDGDLKIGLYGDITPVNEAHEHSFRVIALDTESGEVLWERTAHRGVPKIKRHPKSTHANPTPATDGRVLAVSFGSEGLYVYDLDGELLWKKDLGVLDSGYFRVPTAQWGFGSSPVVADGKVIVQADIQGDSFLATFDAATGRELWRTPREEVPTWGSPTVYRGDGKPQVIVNGYQHLGGYDLATGKPLWWMSGTGDIPVPTPFASGEMVFFSSSHGPGSPLTVVRPDKARGELEPDGRGGEEDPEAAVVWSRERGGSYLPTPIVVGDVLYVGRDNGVLTAYEKDTGRRIYQQRFATRSIGFTSSAVAAGDRLFYTAEDGTTYVVRAGDEYELLATNELGESVLSSPAVSGGVLYFRTRGHLVAVGANGEGEETGEAARRSDSASLRHPASGHPAVYRRGSIDREGEDSPPTGLVLLHMIMYI